MKKAAIALGIFSSIFALAAKADLLQNLQASGVTKIGDLDLRQVSKAATKVQIKTVDQLPVDAGPGRRTHNWAVNGLDAQGKPILVDLGFTTEEGPQATERRSAHYDVAKKSVQIVGDLSAEAAAQTPQLKLHETLGALGYNDKQYGLSTALKILDDTKDPAARRQLLDAYGKTLFQKQNLRSSGGSSVGGGGDVLALTVKHEVLKSLQATGRKLRSDFLIQYPSIGFEPSYKTDKQFVGLDYEMRLRAGVWHQGDLEGVRRDQSLQELVSIHIPALTWSQNPAGRAAMVEEITALILGIFPAFEDTVYKNESMVRGCPASVKVREPVGSDPRTAIIAFQRTDLLYNCSGQADEGLVDLGGFSARIPSEANW
jgi:hypothetical protein